MRKSSFIQALFLTVCWCAIAQTTDPLRLVREGNTEQLKHLIDIRRLDVNYKDPHGRTLLHEAAANGNVPMFKMLISAGGDVDAKDDSGVSPQALVFAIMDNQLRNSLILSFPKTWRAPAKSSPWTLESAISHRQISVVQMLIGLNVDTNTTNRDGESPLYLAAQKGDAEIVRLLLSHGANPNIRTRSGVLPIHAAALAGNTEIVEQILDRGVDINCKVLNTGETPLYDAASFGRLSTVRRLLARGANKSVTNNQGMTALAAAVRAGQTEVVDLLK